MVSTAILFAFIGTALGAFMLAHLSGIPTNLGLGFFPSHPYLQIYGFIAEFVIGVAYSLLPRFKTSQIPRLTFGYATYTLITCANILFLFSPAFPRYDSILGSFASLLILAGSIVFAGHVFSLAFGSVGAFPETNLLMALSSVSLILISLVLFLEKQGVVKTDEIFSPQMIFLSLVGFAGSMIYVVEIRSVSFR